MSEAQFIACQKEVFQLFQEGKIDEVHPLIDKVEQSFPDRISKTIFWRACAFALQHKLDKAISALQAGLEKEVWWNPIILTRDPDLKALQELPEFQSIVATCKDIFESTKSEMTSQLFTYGNPHSETGIFSLHMRGSNARDFAPHWLDNVTSEHYFFGFPQSSQIFGYNAYCWDEQQVVLDELRENFAAFKEKGNTQLDILAGGSQGGKVAIERSLAQTVPVRGFITVIPSVQDVAAFEALIKTAPSDLRGCIITGDQDPFYENTVQLVKLLEEHRIPCKLITIKGLGHFIPNNFSEMLVEAVGFVAN